MKVLQVLIPTVGVCLLLLAVLVALIISRSSRLPVQHPPPVPVPIPDVALDPETDLEAAQEAGTEITGSDENDLSKKTPASGSQLYGIFPSPWAGQVAIAPQPSYGCENPPCGGPATYHPSQPPLLPSSADSDPTSDPTGDRFSCDYMTGTCVVDPEGDLTTCDECEKRTYFCDPASWTCRDVGFLRDSAAQCQRGCYPDLRIRGDYTVKRSDVHANGAGAFCDRGRFRTVGSGFVAGNVPNFEWEDMSCAGHRCCQSHFCDDEGLGTDPYSVTVCAGHATESACTGAINQDVPAYCEWTGSACQAASGEISACAACTADTDCPGKFGAFKCVSGNCVAQGTPKCDAIHKEYRTTEVVPEHIMGACKHLFAKDRDTARRVCAGERDGTACASSYFDRSCLDRYGKTWVTERTSCGPRTAPEYPQVSDSD